MAKSKRVAYEVTDLSALYYAGKVARPGDVVEDIPGESILWLLDEGFIKVVHPLTPETVAPEADVEADEQQTPDEEVANG